MSFLSTITKASLKPEVLKLVCRVQKLHKYDAEVFSRYRAEHFKTVELDIESGFLPVLYRITWESWFFDITVCCALYFISMPLDLNSFCIFLLHSHLSAS